jgi:hypothetical protein
LLKCNDKQVKLSPSVYFWPFGENGQEASGSTIKIGKTLGGVVFFFEFLSQPLFQGFRWVTFHGLAKSICGYWPE